MPKPRKHRDFIVEWADGAEIQWWSDSRKKWIDDDRPIWSLVTKYRIKPKRLSKLERMAKTLAELQHEVERLKQLEELKHGY